MASTQRSSMTFTTARRGPRRTRLHADRAARGLVADLDPGGDGHGAAPQLGAEGAGGDAPHRPLPHAGRDRSVLRRQGQSIRSRSTRWSPTTTCARFPRIQSPGRRTRGRSFRRSPTRATPAPSPASTTSRAVHRHRSRRHRIRGLLEARCASGDQGSGDRRTSKSSSAAASPHLRAHACSFQRTGDASAKSRPDGRRRQSHQASSTLTRPARLRRHATADTSQPHRETAGGRPLPHVTGDCVCGVDGASARDRSSARDR